MKLYSYSLRYDAGSAPNPFWGICTLVICKPVIRRCAEEGDWVVGLGSTKSPIGNKSDYVVYAMRVSRKLTMQKYDEYCRMHHSEKIPQWRNRKDYKLRLGDCIYDYSQGKPPKLRDSVHTERNRERDLGGLYALISNHFYYFGDKPIRLLDPLRPIIHATQGHKSDANQPYIEEFINWIESQGYKLNTLFGEPQLKSEFVLDKGVRAKCAHRDLAIANEDEEIESTSTSKS